MAIVQIDPADIEASYDANGYIVLTDVSTSLLVWGSIRYTALANLSILRRELADKEVLINGDREGAWSKIKAVRDKILADIS